MRRTRVIGNSRPSSEGLSSGPRAEQVAVIPSVEVTDTCSSDEIASGGSSAGALAAGLASPPGLSSPAVAFEVAAVLCGHNINSETGVENARHDFRVWDLVERMRP